MIELTHISKSYSQGNCSTNPLRDINVSIQAGEFVALTGTSGSGKTTCMNILGLIDKPTGGHYYLNGMDVSLLNANEAAYFRNRAFGFIFQLFFLLPHLNILQNTCLPLRYRKLNRDDMEQQAFESLKQVGLKEFTTHKPHQLSGGQQQRVAIARALVGQPKIILADEPTGSLDTKTGQIIMDLLLEINKTHHTTVIIVTHDPHIAQQCTKVLEIIDGQLKD